MSDLSDRQNRRTARRAVSRLNIEHDQVDLHTGPGDLTVPSVLEFTDVGFAEYQRFIIHQLEDISGRIEKMQKSICQMDATIDSLELCTVRNVNPLSYTSSSI
jgi:hypothetical protein